MDRSEKRRIDRTDKKEDKHNLGNEQWLSNLPLNRQSYIKSLIEEKIMIDNNLVASIFDKCVMCSLYDNSDLTEPEIETIIHYSNEYMSYYKEYLELEMNGGNVMNENKELITNVKIKMNQYIAGKMEKAKALKLLKKEFNISNASLSDLWASCKVEKVDNVKDKRAEKIDLEIRASDIVSDGLITVIEPKTIGSGFKIKPGTELGTMELKQAKTDSKLKVLNVITEIQGEYGTYIKSNKGVLVNDKEYLTMKEIEKEATCNSTNMTIEIYELKKQLDVLENELKNVNSKYKELKEVFNY